MESNYSVQLDILDAYSPMDDGHRLDGGNGSAETLEVALPGHGGQGSVRGLQNRRFQYSYLRLSRPTDLSLVPALGSLHLNRMKRSISHETAIEIAARLPNIS